MSENEKWSQRRLRHCKQYGIKSDVASEKLRAEKLPNKTSPGSYPLDEDDSRRSYNVTGLSTHTARSVGVSRTQSLDSARIAYDVGSGDVSKRESVLQMACKGINSVMNGDFFRRIQNGSASRAHAATVDRIPTYISVHDKDRTLLGYCSFPSSNQHEHRNSRCEAQGAVQSGAGLRAKFTEGNLTEIERTYDGFVEPTTNYFLNSQDQIENLDDDAILDVIFVDQQETDTVMASKTEESNNNKQQSRNRITSQLDQTSGLDRLTDNTTVISKKPKKLSKFHQFVNLFGESKEDRVSRLRSLGKFNFSIRKGGGGVNELEKPTKMPMYGKFITDPELVKKLMDDSWDYRPFFTYWISTVHVLVLFFMVFSYGIDTDFPNIFYNTFGIIERSGDVMTSSLSAAHIVVWEQNNIWIGPKYADLVHAGAKYTPCMRRDEKIYEQILQERRIEAETTGCCIGPWGCYQTSECPKQFAQLLQWTNGSFPESDYSRVVCGQDSRYCVRPRSVHPFLWGINISNWPICEQRSSSIPSKETHMHCEITGHPCCIQMHGQCRITSMEYCDFVGGYYHQNATLCSQVSCLNEVCGMTPFFRKDNPDQIYRLIAPLFIHAGIIRCAISLVIYLTIMRKFEIMIGWLRLSIIYFISGIGGYLASAIFVPYMPEVGPAGSEGGILGALIVNIVYNWDLLSQPYRALLFHLAIAGFLFILGFLPWIDNWAQVFGFIFGSLMAIVLIPYITIGKGRVSKRLPIVVGSLCITALLFAILLILFFAYPINFEALGLLNCPIPTKICDHQGLILRNWLPI